MNTVTVTGLGASSEVPDIAVVRFAVSARDASLAGAYASTSELARRAGTVAGEHVGEAMVSSSGLQVWQAHDHQGVRDGFEARHSFVARCPDLPVAGELLEALVAAIGDRLMVEDVTLQLRDPAVALGRAREAAFADARRRAAQLADLAGRGLGVVTDVVEGEDLGVVAQGALFARSEAGFSAGEQRVDARVRVTFELLG